MSKPDKTTRLKVLDTFATVLGAGMWIGTASFGYGLATMCLTFIMIRMWAWS